MCGFFRISQKMGSIFSFLRLSSSLAIMEEPTNPISGVIDSEKLLIESGLNEDVLVSIFKYLDICDLLKVCELDNEDKQTFINLIKSRLAHTIVFDFHQIQSMKSNKWPVQKVFQTFGETMRLLKVCVT